MADSDPDSPAERRLMGAALRRLREQRGLTQTAAADRAGITLQAWGNYENGRRRFSRSLIDKTTTALGFEPEDLLIERTRADEGGLPSGDPARMLDERWARRYELPIVGVVRAGGLAAAFQPPSEPDTLDLMPFFSPENRVLMIQGESMIPYAQPGGWVTYNIKSWPRRGDGCVIVFKDDRDPLVKRFEKTLGGSLYVTELFPAERELTFDLGEISGVYRVGLRAD